MTEHNVTLAALTGIMIIAMIVLRSGIVICQRAHDHNVVHYSVREPINKLPVAGTFHSRRRERVPQLYILEIELNKLAVSL